MRTSRNRRNYYKNKFTNLLLQGWEFFRRSNKETKISIISLFFTIILFVITTGVSIYAISKTEKSNKIALESNNIASQSAFIASQALKASQDANKIANEAKDNAKYFGIDDKKTKSGEIVDKFYDDIIKDGTNTQILDLITTGKKIKDIKRLRDFVDIFENLGGKYCSGIVYGDQVQASFGIMLQAICNNQQIFNTFNGEKNGTSMLCYKFAQDSLFAQIVNKDRMRSCRFIEN